MVWVLAAWLTLAGAAPDPAALFPAELAGWSRTAAPAEYDPKTVFDYMDGHAEIYLTYSFQRIWTAPYRLGQQGAVVEVYDMGTPAEAFGIWSNELDGEPVTGLEDARYAGGELRGRQSRYFVRVAGDSETPEVAALGRAAAPQLGALLGPAGGEPALLRALPRLPLQLKRERFFHRDSNLNAFHYIHTTNVLALGAATDGAFAEGTLGDSALKVALIEYPAIGQAERGWQGFIGRVLSPQARAASANERVEAMQPGQWTGIRRMRGPRNQPRLALCFEAPDEAACLRALALLAQQSHRE